MKALVFVLLIYLIEHLTKKNAVFTFHFGLSEQFLVLIPGKTCISLLSFLLATSTEHKIHSLKLVQDKKINCETLKYLEKKLFMVWNHLVWKRHLNVSPTYPNTDKSTTKPCL